MIARDTIQNPFCVELLNGAKINKHRKFPPHMIVQDHMVIDFGKIVHPTFLYGTTRQLGPLEYGHLDYYQFTTNIE